MAQFQLPPRCDRAAAEALLPALIAAGPGPHTIDGSEVSQLGQAMLQVLVSAHRAGAAITPSGSLRDAARLVGLADELFDGDTP